MRYGLAGEIGIRAKTQGLGLHFLIPFLYVPTKFPFTNILEDEIGLAESIDGEAIPPGKIFAKVSKATTPSRTASTS